MPNNLVEGSLEFVEANGGQLIRARAENRTSDPSTLTIGMYWVRTDLSPKELRWYDGAVKTVAAFSTEDVQDIVGALFADTATVDVTYNDAGNVVSLAVLDSPTLQGHDSAYHLSRGNHSGTQAAVTISDFDAAVRANRLDQLTAPTTPVAMGSQRITGVADPSSAQDAATKAYVDAAAAGIDWKSSVRIASTGNLGLTGLSAIDGVTPVAGDRVLAKDQTTGANNGIYVAASGAWTRAADADSSAEVTSGLGVFVEEGTVNADTGWTLTTNGPITLGTTALTFAQFTSLGQITAGAGLTKTGSTIDVGQGTGITVNANDVAVDTALVSRRTAGDLGASTTPTLVHSFGTKDVSAEVRRVSDDQVVAVPWVPTDVNTVTFYFDNAPTAGAYRASVRT